VVKYDLIVENRVFKCNSAMFWSFYINCPRLFNELVFI